MKTILNPNLYHGSKKKRNFFEGWYFKIVDKNNLYKFAFIPGVSLGENNLQHHSFIQIVDCHKINYNYLKFDKNSFKYDNNNFHISINANKFSLNEINLNIDRIKGNIKFKNIVKWPDSKINPGSMGFYNYLLFMECYSQVCALDGTIEGCLEIDGKMVDFNGGKVYIEKNWGSSFPKSWVWIQSNSFLEKNVSVTCSLATIPFPLIKNFRGFLIGVTIDDEFYSFTTINKSKLSLKTKGKDIILNVCNEKYSLTLKTHSDEDKFVLCMGPKNGDMVPLVKETLSASVDMILRNRKTNQILYKGIGRSTGIEYGGDMMDILD